MNYRPEMRMVALIRTDIMEPDSHEVESMLSHFSQHRYRKKWLAYLNVCRMVLTHISCRVVVNMLFKDPGFKKIDSAFK